jgi:hypothetical protein
MLRSTRPFRQPGSDTSTGLSLDTSSCPITCIFFAEPGEQPLPFDDWITVWKSGVTRILKKPEWRWQAGSFHHRIRSYEDYNEKRNFHGSEPCRSRASRSNRGLALPGRGVSALSSVALNALPGRNDGGRAKHDPGRGHTHSAAQIRRG